MIKEPGLRPSQIGAAIKAFMAEFCPACSVEKVKIREPFCDDCIEELPAALREGVRDNSRFIDMFHPAMECLAAARK